MHICVYMHICVCKDIYYKGLAHVIIEARFHNLLLPAENPGILVMQF